MRKGYASEAILLVLRYYFLELGYQKVTATVYSFNTPSISLHERLGFQPEGRVRRTVYTQGQHFDELIFGMTREEFEAQHLSIGPA
jgi:RimJ/RimL family protein N-acetyltransferase